MTMWWWTLALAEPLADVERLETLVGHTCAWVADDEVPLCWRGWGEARPRPDLRVAQQEKLESVSWSGEPPSWPAVPTHAEGVGRSVCARTGEGEVWCQGADWRALFGMPAGTPDDRPVRVDELAGAEALGAGGCVLRARTVVCPTANGAQERLRDVRSFSSHGVALLGDDTAWDYRTPTPRKLHEEVVAVTPRRDLWQQADGTVVSESYGRLVKAVPGVKGGRPAGLVGHRTRGCVINPERGVTCWGDNRSGSLPGVGDLQVYWGEAQPDRSWARDVCRLRDGKVTCSESPTGSPTHPLVQLEGVEELVRAYELYCARTGDTLDCFGVVADGMLLAGDDVLSGVVDVATSPYQLAVLLDDGRVLTRTSEWVELLQVPPEATEVGVGAYLTCVGSETSLHCVGDGGATKVLPRPAGPWTDDLCFEEGCLTTEVPSEQLARPWTVQRETP